MFRDSKTHVSDAAYLKDIRNPSTDQALRKEAQQIPSIVVIGPTHVGKTTTINKLFGTNLPTGDVTRGTHEPIENKVETPNGPITVIDMPGLGETIEIHKSYLGSYYPKFLPKADVVLWIMLPTKHLEPDQRYLNDLRSVIPSEVFNRIIFCINKVDLVQPGEWIKRANLPDKSMRGSIAGFVALVSAVFRVPEDRVVPCAALHGYNLNLLALRMLQAVPSRRRVLLDSRTSPASPLAAMSSEYTKLYEQTLGRALKS